ncbi:unnamed protein product [Linum trigynum]|uniref:Uncharacterized protein n=1 Tax=Linum trigynum TaxID=586398 RepID=A0AAV2GAV8_9ROSI
MDSPGFSADQTKMHSAPLLLSVAFSPSPLLSAEILTREFQFLSPPPLKLNLLRLRGKLVAPILPRNDDDVPPAAVD